MKYKLLSTYLLTGILFASCQMIQNPQLDSVIGSTGLKIKVNSESPRTISVSQWEVTSLDIQVNGPATKSFTWIPGDSSQLSTELPLGTYTIKVIHHGVANGIAVTAEESAAFSIDIGKVTVVQVTPGGLGTIEVASSDTSIPVADPVTLQELKRAFVGTWKGTMTCPWQEPSIVTFSFREDGTYSSKAEANGPALYYGSDSDSALKVYEIYDISQTEMRFGLGRLTVYFSGSETTVVEDLQEIQILGNTLSFRFKHFNEYGPIVYSLERQ